MTQHDPSAVLRDMLDYAERAVEFAADYAVEELEQDAMRRMALAYALIAVGEAATRAPVSLRESFPDIPWSQTVRLRNRIIHGYDTIDYDIVKEIVDHDLPPLIQSIRDAIGALDGEEPEPAG
jgi:uncharacterized protein with HEPN domain